MTNSTHTPATTHRSISFLLNGSLVELASVEPTRSVLSYLREDQRLTGTKEGCAEGDCGACTVVLGELVNDALQLRAVNACIQFVPMLDGKALFTIESLKAANGSLHPVQQAMVEHHGSQCGFCTPGIVMSLWNCYVDTDSQAPRPSRTRLADLLSGNLCRCTGYRPIIDAGEAMFDLPRSSFDRMKVAAQLRELREAQAPGALSFSHGNHSFHAPRQLDELVRLRHDKPEATLLAGCTDIGLWVNKQFRELGDILYVGEVSELKQLYIRNNTLHIGAGVSLSDAYAAIAEHYPMLQEMWERFASIPIRNAGTLGGNIANGSPIGDSMPWLITLEAQVVLVGLTGTRTLPLEDLYIGYMEKSMQEYEVVAAVKLPLPVPGLQFRSYKLSKRYDSDISAVCAAFALQIVDDRIIRARVAFGGMAATPCRAKGCERALESQAWSETTVRAAMQALQDDYSPLGDMRASAGYRSRTATNLLYRFYLETRHDNPLTSEQTSVFTRTLEAV